MKASSLERLCANFLEASNFIHRTIFENTPGNPVIFPAKFKEDLKNLPQDCGGSYLTKKYPEQVRYIPVQDSLELYDIDTKEDLEKLCWKVINGFIGVIETEPTVDAVEVVHGEWIYNGRTDSLGVPKPFSTKCSVCESSAGASWMKFCPNCGAKMDGGEKA